MNLKKNGMFFSNKPAKILKIGNRSYTSKKYFNIRSQLYQNKKIQKAIT